MRQIFIVIIVFFSLTSFSQDRYWVESSAANWSSDSWSSTSGGVADAGGPPTGVEVARFDANGLGNCNVDVAASFGGLIVNGYTGIVDINGNSFTTSGTVTLTSGTINDTPGTSELTINSSDASVTRFNGSTLGADVTCTTGGIDFDGSVFNGDFTGTKIGTSNHDGAGGNTFNGSFTLTLQGDGGRIRMGRSNPDTFNSNVTINSNSGSTLEFADNSAGNSITGDLNLNLTDTSGTISISDETNATLTISGDVNIIHNRTSNAYVYLGDNGDLTIGGNLTYTNSSSGTNNLFYLGTNANSVSIINGTTTITNNASSNNSRFYIGNNGDVTFNGQLNIINNSTSNNNEIYLNNNSNSSNIYNQNIIVESTNAASDGVFFGNGGGSGTIATGRTISI